MKNLYKISLLFSIALFSACEEYLSEVPDNRAQIDSEGKISELLAAAYSLGNYMEIAETMSDNVSDRNRSNETELNNALYNWEVPILNGTDSPTNYWNDSYEAIAQANQALASLKELNLEKERPDLKGEALISRAYHHFMLVNLWAKHYNPATASSDLGITYITEPETEFIVEYTRNSVQEVYNLIEKDLLEGLPLLTNEYEHPKFRFTPEAGNAFATRFYLYKGEWDKVIEHSSKILLDNPVSQLRDLNNTYDNLDFSQRQLRYGSAVENSNLLVASNLSIYQRRYATNKYGLTARQVEEFFRENNIFLERDEFNVIIKNRGWVYDVFGVSGNAARQPKFEEFFRVTNQTAQIGLPYTQIVLFSIEDVLLGRAEAYAMKEQYDLANNDLTAIFSQRTAGYNPDEDIIDVDLVERKYPQIPNEFEPFYNLNSTQASYVKAIAELRRREFYHEGHRWFDVRRFNLEIEHNFVSGAQSIVLEKDDNRRQLQIPVDAISNGIAPNPR